MKEPKQKPKMKSPKLLDKASATVKSAGNLLAREYKKAANDKQNRYSPSEYAIDKVELGARQGARLTGRASALGIRKTAKYIKARKRTESNSDGEYAQDNEQFDTKNPETQKKQKNRQPQRQTANKVSRETPITDSTSTTYTSERPTERVIQSSTDAVRQVNSKNKVLKKKQNALAAKTKDTVAKSANIAKQKAQQNARREAFKQAAQKTAAVAKSTANFTSRMVRLVAKAATAFVKSAALIFGAVGTVLVPFLIVAAIAAIICSPFGILFSNEADNDMYVSDAIGTLSAEYYAEIENIQSENPHDTLELSGTGITNCRDILAIYAVKTTTTKDGTDVITMDDDHLEILRSVFWDMVKIEHHTEETETSETVTSTDEDGNEVTETVTTIKTTLYISTTLKSYSEIMEQYSFDNDQTKLVNELMSEEYDEYFSELIATFGDAGSTGTISLGIYIWPSDNSNYVTSFFGTRIHPIYGDVRHHNGIDIGAAYGTNVLAAASGTVTYSGWMSGYGNTIIIDHGTGNKTLYAHMSQLNVSAGQTVTQGQVIGLVGSTGNSTGPHLHFETYVNDSRVDPLLYFDNYTAAW